MKDGKSPGANESRGTSVLLVDDDAAVARLGRRVLERLGHSVTTFLFPKAAFAALREDPARYDLLVTDHRMPEMTGQQLLQEIQAEGIGIPALIVSGYSDEIDRTVVRKYGPALILDKPYTKEEMRMALETLAGPGTQA